MTARVLSPSRIALLAALAAAVALYAPVVSGLVRQWMTEPASSQGLLLLGVAVFLVYRRIDAWQVTAIEPRDAGLVVVAAALGIFTLGTITGEVFVLRMSMPLAIAGAVLAAAGVDHLRLMTAPLALFTLAIPLPAVVVTHATMPLQLIASQVAAGVLEACRVPVMREGNLLMLNRVTLEVADACSGLRSLVSLISVTAVCAAFVSMSARRVALLMLAAVPIAIVGNGLRVAATGLLASSIGEVAARGFLHDLTGYVAFVAMCAAIIGLQMASRRRMALA